MTLDNRMLSAAPFFEDVFLHRCFKPTPALAYAELDPGDPSRDSVSQWFDLSGWRGLIAVDEDKAAWEAARPNAAVIGAEEDVSRTGWIADQNSRFGFVRFARPRQDAARIITALRPLIVLTPDSADIPGYRRVHGAGLQASEPWYFARDDRAAELAPHFAASLARDEFVATERQAAVLARMLAVSAAAIVQNHADLGRLNREIVLRDQDIQARDQDIQARDRDIQAREQDIQARDQAMRARDLDVLALNQELQARDRDINARDQTIASLHKILAAKDAEIALLRPQAERLQRLAARLDWPDAPRAVQAVLPLARLLRKVRHKIK